MRKRGASKRPANFIRHWREFRGITSQGQLAERCEMNRETICRLESGVLEYRQKFLERIAKVLRCSPADLLSVDPANMPDILKIYSRIPQDRRAIALRALTAFLEDALPD